MCPEAVTSDWEGPTGVQICFCLLVCSRLSFQIQVRVTLGGAMGHRVQGHSSDSGCTPGSGGLADATSGWRPVHCPFSG